MSNVFKLPRSTQPTIVKVSHITRHRKQKHSGNVIHVNLHSSRDTRLINNTSSSINNHSSILSMKNQFKNSFITENSLDKPTNTTSLSVRQNTWENEDADRYSTEEQRSVPNYQAFDPREGFNDQIDQPDPILDHHRKKKKKNKQCRCIFKSVCLLAILVGIAVAVALAILLSRKPTTTTRSSLNASLRWNSFGITILGQAGVSGANSSLLYWPYGLALDSSNTLYVADYHNHRIQKLLSDTSTSVTVAGNTNGLWGTAMDRLNFPVGILFDANDNMYITDRVNKRVQFWAKGATSGTEVAGINGTLNISLAGPSGIVADPNSGTIFITDTYNHRVVSYPTGNVVAGGNGAGNNETTLYNPYGLVYDSVTNSVVMPNYNTNNIVRWVLGATNRTYVAGDIMGSPGGTSTLLRNPVGMTMDPMGNIYVADSSNHRIQFFLAGESNATTITGTGTAGTNANQLNSPFWVILDNQLNLYVSDTFNNRVQKFLRY